MVRTVSRGPSAVASWIPYPLLDRDITPYSRIAINVYDRKKAGVEGYDLGTAMFRLADVVPHLDGVSIC